MRLDSLKKYISLREELTGEKRELEQRLAAINNALGEASGASTAQSNAGSAQPQRAQAAPVKTQGAARRGRPAKSGLSLREAVIQVLSGGGPKGKEEILKGVQSLGYRFSTKDPMNSLGVILYGKNPKLNRENGQFSLGKGAGNASNAASSNNASGSAVKKGTRGGRRQLSPEARERIAAAQRARWAKAKGGK